MMLAHGFGCDQNMWRFITPAFEADYRVILFDYVGSGKSDLTAYNADRYNHLNGYAQDILDICQALDLTDVVFVGHSVSAMTGLLAALRERRYFARQVWIGPSARYLNDASTTYVGGFEPADIDEFLELMDHNFLRWANTFAPAIMANAGQPGLGQELEQSFCSTDTTVMQQFARATLLSDNRSDLSKLQQPTLILQCADDIIAPLVVGEYIQSQLPNGTLRYMEATGHCPHLSAPSETIKLMREFLANV